jgi:hypothetical protein
MILLISCSLGNPLSKHTLSKNDYKSEFWRDFEKVEIKNVITTYVRNYLKKLSLQDPSIIFP